MKKQLLFSTLFLSALTPLIASADKITDFGSTISSINANIVSALATLFMALATTAFFYGMAIFIFASRTGEVTKMANGRQFMLWGVISLFVMVSIWGIIRYAQRTIGIDGDVSVIQLPTFGFSKTGTTPTGSTPSSGGPSTNSSCPEGNPCSTCIAPAGYGCSCAGGFCKVDYTRTTSSSGAGAGDFGASCAISGANSCKSGLSCVPLDMDTGTCGCSNGTNFDPNTGTCVSGSTVGP